MCFAPQWHAIFQNLNFQKWSENGVLYTFWLGNLLRTTNFLHISTSKSGPRIVCFVHFDLDMCFAPQPRTLFRHLNFYKCSAEREVFLPFFTSKCASGHNGVQPFISHLTRWLCTRCFSKPTFRPSRATNHWKTQWIATFLPFRAPTSSFLSLFLFSDLLTSCPLLLGSSHRCFSICPYCRMTSKLPSMIGTYERKMMIN